MRKRLFLTGVWRNKLAKQQGKNEKTPRLGEFHFAGDDAVVPFEVAALDIRGRAVQLGPMLDAILTRHDYPQPVARLLAEAMVLTALLGSSLKFEGKFIFQTRSDGPVTMLVCDFTPPSAIRAYAHFHEEKLAQLITENRTSPAELLGKGTLALTVDQGLDMQRYHGIVALDGSSLEEIAHAYFDQSEQIPTRVRLGASPGFTAATATALQEKAGGQAACWSNSCRLHPYGSRMRKTKAAAQNAMSAGAKQRPLQAQLRIRN